MSTGFKVTGAAVVLPTLVGGERYLYRSGAVLPVEGFTEEGLAHAQAVGLIELIELDDVETEEESAEDDAPAMAWTHEQLDDWAAKQEPPIDFAAWAAKQEPPLDPEKRPTKEQKLQAIAEAKAAAAEQNQQ